MTTSNGRRYLPIAEHGVIGDLRSVALVGSEGTIDWYCCPRFDSPSVFGALLDSERGGFYRIAPVDECSTKQLYFPDTNVLLTRFLSSAGVAEVQDFMPVPRGKTLDGQRLIRRVTCVRGAMRFRLECEPRFNYGRDPHEVELGEGGAIFRSPGLTLALGAPVPLVRTARGAAAEFELRPGETVTFVLEQPTAGGRPAPLGAEAAEALVDETVAYWIDWVSQSRYTGRWREMVNRSALALKQIGRAHV